MIVAVLGMALVGTLLVIFRGQAASSIVDYLSKPLLLRGSVGLKEIGTEHPYFPDVLLCSLLGAPGVVLFFTHHSSLSLGLRSWVLIESVVVGAASTYADGLLNEDYLWVDQKTSVVHVLTWASLLSYYLGPRLDPAMATSLAAGAILSLAIFHRRLHETYCKRNWRAARWCARLWHIGGFIFPLALVLSTTEATGMTHRP